MLLAGYPPFHGDEKLMMQKIKQADADWSHKSRWKPVSADAIDFLRKLIIKDASERLDVHQALQHRWLAPDAVRAPATLNRDALRSLQRYADASRVRRAVLQLLALELEPEETRELQETFLSIDKSNEGMICLRDLKDAIRNGARSPTRRRRQPKTPGTGGSNTLQVPSGSTPPYAAQNTPSPFGAKFGIEDLDTSMLSLNSSFGSVPNESFNHSLPASPA